MDHADLSVERMHKAYRYKYEQKEARRQGDPDDGRVKYTGHRDISVHDAYKSSGPRDHYCGAIENATGTVRTEAPYGDYYWL